MIRSIAANHALEDGNKRLAVTVLHSTLLVNGLIYLWSDEDAEALVLRCASGETDYRWLSEFIEIWTMDGSPVLLAPEPIRAAMDDLRVFTAEAFATDILGGALLRLVQAVVSAHVRGQLGREAIDVGLRIRRARPSRAP